DHGFIRAVGVDAWTVENEIARGWRAKLHDISTAKLQVVGESAGRSISGADTGKGVAIIIAIKDQSAGAQSGVRRNREHIAIAINDGGTDVSVIRAEDQGAAAELI